MRKVKGIPMIAVRAVCDVFKKRIQMLKKGKNGVDIKHLL